MIKNIDNINYKDFKLDLIPDKLSISTMTINCNLNTILYLDYIYNHFEIDKNNIIAIKTRKNNITKYIEDKDIKFKSINKNIKKSFYNQMTLVMNVVDDIYLNFKLFRNGAVQITGCKSLENVNLGLNKLINQLAEEKTIYDENNDSTKIKFVENKFDLKVINLKIDLINTNFAINYKINKENLYSLLIKNNILCRISSIHVCVNIKYKIDKNTFVSIFIFQTGNIIIIGKKPDDILLAYKFIIKFLNMNKYKIIKKNISDFFDTNYINNFIKTYKSLENVTI